MNQQIKRLIKHLLNIWVGIDYTERIEAVMLILKQENKENEVHSEQIQAKSLLILGMKLYGYCCGYFGRDSYGVKTIIHVGDKKIMVRYEDDTVDFSFEIDDWVGLIKSSNAALESGEY